MVCSALVFVYCRNESVGVKRKFTWIRFAITKYHVTTHTQHIPLNKKKQKKDVERSERILNGKNLFRCSVVTRKTRRARLQCGFGSMKEKY